METNAIAIRLVELLREGKFETIYDELFDTDRVRHIEPQSEHFSEVVGVAAIKEKDALMTANIASFGNMEVGDPIVAGRHFAIPYKMSFTLKDGTPVNMDEIILYEVDNGKVVLEQFFY
ncbi:MAG: nuclear transport factor 2 family protein [Bacteroidota bacterium]